MTISRHNLAKLALLGFGLLAVVFYNSSFRDRNQPSVKSASSPDGQSHPVIFYDDWRFFQAVNSASEEKNQIEEIKGGIIPHHLLASSIIADFFERLKAQKPDTIILIGPNHREAGDFKALTSSYKWQTPFGFVEPDSQAIGQLIERNVVRADEEVLPKEHSIAGLMPFTKYYLPETKVIPIIVSGTMTAQETQILAQALIEIMNDETVVISGVDFSHYLNAEEAASKDVVTLKMIEDFDYEHLFVLGNDYLDSASSIAVLLLIMQKQGFQRLEVLYHKNSADLLGESGRPTTSYFSIVFHP